LLVAIIIIIIDVLGHIPYQTKLLTLLTTVVVMIITSRVTYPTFTPLWQWYMCMEVGGGRERGEEDVKEEASRESQNKTLPL